MERSETNAAHTLCSGATSTFPTNVGLKRRKGRAWFFVLALLTLPILLYVLFINILEILRGVVRADRWWQDAVICRKKLMRDTDSQHFHKEDCEAKRHKSVSLLCLNGTLVPEGPRRCLEISLRNNNLTQTDSEEGGQHSHPLGGSV